MQRSTIIDDSFPDFFLMSPSSRHRAPEKGCKFNKNKGETAYGGADRPSKTGPVLSGLLQPRDVVEWQPCVPVAQLDRALDSGSKGRRFESSQARHVFPPYGQ